MSGYLKDWTPAEFEKLEEGVICARHTLHESGLFSDENLARIIDTHPPECLHINTMGTDTNKFEWREGTREGVSGEVVLETMKKGRLWLNARNMLDHHSDFAEAFNEVYDELEANNPKFKANDRSANLLISSPGALVHYHIDIPVNMLWHMRGRKRVWVYPHFDDRFVPQEMVEKVCAGELSEDVPYDPEFDKYALVFDAEPGQLITWPQLTPHRVTNLEGLCVSLSTEHKNPAATRRINVHLANQFLRRSLGWDCKSHDVRGWAPHAKQSVARAARLWKKLTGKKKQHFTYPVTFRVDPDAPLGYTDIDGEFDGTYVAPHEELVATS